VKESDVTDSPIQNEADVEAEHDRAAPKAVQHLTLAERMARGKAAREDVPRSSHAAWEPPSGRPDPVDLLEAQAESRVPELVPIRYGRMLVSPFTFYRGAAYLMASDLAQLPRTTLHAQLCGDAHLSNFGGYSAPDRRLVFDINDFDETHPGPFEWDLKRLVTSFAVAGRNRGFDSPAREEINRTVSRSYRESMASFAAMRTFDVWYARIDVDDVRKMSTQLSGAAIKRFEKNVAKARTRDSLAAFAKLTKMVDGEPRFISDPPLIVPAEELYGETSDEVIDEVRGVIRSYRRTLQNDRQHLLERFRLVDLARKVVGVGSVGTRAWIALFVGRDSQDPLILQIKEAQASVLEPFLGKSGFASHGQRVVDGQRLMQAASDLMLGWLRTPGVDGVERDFYVRQLWDSKGSAQVDLLEPRAMGWYGRFCGETLARAHARSGDAASIASYVGSGSTFDRAIAAFAEAYADQNERDYAALKDAAESGRVEVQTGL
jgi:uncharacterized protein (DUF2252 family)